MSWKGAAFAPEPRDTVPRGPPPAAAGVVELRPGSLGGAELRPGSPTGAELRPGSPTGAELRPGSPTGAELRPGSPTGAELRPGGGPSGCLGTEERPPLAGGSFGTTFGAGRRKAGSGVSAGRGINFTGGPVAGAVPDFPVVDKTPGDTVAGAFTGTDPAGTGVGPAGIGVGPAGIGGGPATIGTGRVDTGVDPAGIGTGPVDTVVDPASIGTGPVDTVVEPEPITTEPEPTGTEIIAGAGVIGAPSEADTATTLATIGGGVSGALPADAPIADAPMGYTT